MKKLSSFKVSAVVGLSLLAGMANIASAAAPTYTVRFYSAGLKASSALRFTDSNGVFASTLSFPTTTEGSSSPPVTFNVKNMSTTGVVFQATPFTVTAPFSLSGTTCTGTLAPAASCSVTLSYSPPYYQTTTGQFFTINTTPSGIAAPSFFAKAASLPYANVVSTYNHAFFKKNDGRWIAVGDDYYGQIGGMGIYTAPAGNPAIFGATQIATGVFHTLALMADGTVKATGYNAQGQLGLGDLLKRAAFVTIPGISGAKAVAASAYSSYIQLSDNSWVSAGANSRGQLGLGDTSNRATFTAIPGSAGSLAFTTGHQSIFLKTAAGAWSAAGMNNSGQLGLGDTVDRPSFTLMPGISGSSTIYSAYSTTFVKDASNNWLAAGDNSNNLYGSAAATSTSFVPAPALNGSVAMAVGMESYSAFVMSAGGSWYGVGGNGQGQLGLGDFTNRTVYTLNSVMTGSSLVTANLDSTFFIKAGALFSTGSNVNDGHIGQPGDILYSSFTQVTP